MNKKIGLKLLSVLITSAIVFMSFSATVLADENVNENADTDVQIENEEDLSDDNDVDIEESDSDVTEDESDTNVADIVSDETDVTAGEETDVPEAIDESLPDDESQDELIEADETTSEDDEHPDIFIEYYGETSIIPYEDEYSTRVSANYGTVSYGSGMYKKQFSDVDEATYEILTNKISLVANGQLLDTQFLINLDELGFDNVFTAEELGIEYIYKDGASYPNIGNILFNHVICDWTPTLHRLLVEYPYELYWFDKTTSTGIRMSTPEMDLKWDKDLQQYVATYDGGLIYYFPVCEAYAEDDFLVDINQTIRAKNAASYAQKIVNQNAALSDIDKLNKYKEVICDLVDYNTPAAENSSTPYGDPWNLVYVFDRDPETKVVCEGYSKAFKYLCDLSSFENSDLTCILASGYFQSDTTYGPHMWNIVSLGDGLNYMVDVTNCDTGTIGAPNYLFLRNVDSGSASNTYTYTLYIYGRTNNLYYTYKTETLDLYNIEPLTINTSPLFDAPEVILSATCSGIELQWLKEHTAYSYDIYRRTSNSMWSLVSNTTNNSYTDTTVTANMQYYYCIVCKNANGEKMNQFDDQYTITAVTHSIVVDQAVPVTCTTDGLTEGSHCSTCGKIIVAQQVIEAKGHTVVVDPGIDATCEHVGLTEGSHCSVCNKVLVAQEIIPTLEHEVVTVPGKPATGTEDGYTDYQYCSICGLVLKPRTIIPATGQSNENEDDPYVEPYVEPYDKNKYDFDVSTSYNGKNLTITGVLKNPEIANNIAGVNVYYRKPDMDDYIFFTEVPVVDDSFTLDRSGLTEGIEYSFIFEFYFKDGYIMFHEKHIDVIFGNQDEPYIFAIVNQPSDYTGSVGKVATFSVKAQGTDLKYQWQVYKNGSWSDSSLPGAKTNTISIDITAARNGYKFRCNVSDVNGHVITSREAKLYVKSVLSVIEQPNDYFGFVGEHATFYVVATGEGLSYQWQVNKNGTWINSSLPGAKSDSLHFDITAARNGYKFRCVIKDTKGNTVTSDFATLVVYQSFAITKNPENCSGPVNGTALFKVIASGDDLKYQWQVNSNGTWRDSSMPGAKTDTLSVSITTARNGYKFRCVVKTANGAESITSNEATLTVVQSLTITSDPANYTGVAGGKAVFTVTADGIGLKYQWQVNKNGTWADSSMTGCKTDTLTVDITSARNGYKFRCVIRDAVGNTVTSKDATLSVAQAINITAQPLNYTGPAGDTAIFKVAAEGEGLTYQWQVNKNGTWANSSMTGCKTNSLSVNITDARDGYKFRCVIKNASGITVTTEEVTLFVGNPYFVVD